LAIFPFLLLIISILSYGGFLPFLGYYDDEWVGVYNLTALGHSALVDYTSMDRPFWGEVWSIFGFFFGENPLVWHTAAITARWMSSVALWLMLRLLWPERIKESSLLALLFLVYPGILQESRGFFFFFFWLQLALVFFSFGIMMKAVLSIRNRVFLHAIALILIIPNWLINEYFIGLEILRPLVLWHVYQRQSNTYTKSMVFGVLKHWTPYCISFLGYLFWRFLFVTNGREEVNPVHFLSTLYANPTQELISRFDRVLPDIVEITILVWSQILSSKLFQLTSLSSGLAWLLGIIAAAISLRFFLKSRFLHAHSSQHTAIEDKRFGTTLLFGGLAISVFGMTPFWFSGVEFQLTSMETRYALPTISGACMILLGLVWKLTGDWNRALAFCCILTSLAVATHNKVANDYRHDWLDQKNLIWQLTWRIPNLTPGTLIILDHQSWQTDRWSAPFGGIHYSAPVNLAYNPASTSTALDYWVLPLENNESKVHSIITSAEPFQKRVRNLTFTQKPGHQIIISNSPEGCLEVIDYNSANYLDNRGFIHEIAHLSDTSLILDHTGTPARPPEVIFGAEPDHGWCYYYQKSQLALQFDDWKSLLLLRKQADEAGLSISKREAWRIFQAQ
jgi:hypothetical protein